MKIEQYDYVGEHWDEIFTNPREDIVIDEYENIIKTSVVPIRVTDSSVVLRLFHPGNGYHGKKAKEEAAEHAKAG